MALVLKLKKNCDVYVGATRIVMAEIISDTSFKIMVHLPQHHKIVTVTDSESVEILPNVRVSAGIGVGSDFGAIAIEAPRDIRIYRGSLYRRGAACQPKKLLSPAKQ